LHPPEGYKHTEEDKRRMSEMKKGKPSPAAMKVLLVDITDPTADILYFLSLRERVMRKQLVTLIWVSI